MKELELITKAQLGDQKAFCGLYDQYKDRLYRYAFYRLRSQADAEDAVSECVLSAWKQIGNLKEPKAFPAWIFRILAASCNKFIKDQIARRDMISLDDTAKAVSADSGALPQINAKDMDVSMILQDALDSISEEERNMVLLSVVGGLNSGEIAEITGLAAGSVRSSLSRSFKKMRGYLE